MNFNPVGVGFSLDLTKHNALFKLTTELLGITLKMPEDRSNNSESTIITNQI